GGGATGTPDLHPSDGLAIGTVNGDSDCLDPGHFAAYNDNGVEITVAVGEVDGGTTSLHETVFGTALSESDIKMLAIEIPNAFVYVDSSNASTYLSGGVDGNWHTSMGSNSVDSSGNANDQVVIYFEESAGCPTLNAGVVIYGLVFYEKEDCNLQGGGAADVHGTVAVSGDLGKFNANTDLIKQNLDAFSGPNRPYELVSVIPGSFVDY
ncbi:MAG: hypothetical protein DRR42_22875, partial [Gammaproteobacteria bacterium]